MPRVALAMLAVGSAVRADTVVFVNHAAPGPIHDGTSWVNAHQDLQVAIQSAPPNSSLWVAEGVYVPGEARTNAFVLSDVSLYGGFAQGMQSLAERDWEAHPTVLSGEIGHPGLRSDNSYRIILVVSNVTVDGVTLTRAYNDGPAVDPRNPGANEGKRGGAISAIFDESRWMHAAPLTIRNCRFVDNRAGAGGAIRLSANAYLWTNHTEAVLIENCSFIDNQAIGGGPISEGGAIHLGSGNDKVLVRNCVFYNNQADYGGAVSLQYTVGNTPSRFERCTFHGNTATDGHAIIMRFADAQMELHDSIVWNGGANQIHLKDNCHLRIAFTCLQGGLGTTSIRSGSSQTALGGMLTADPLFADAAAGDFHLRSQAGRWTPGGWVTDVQTSPAIAAGDPDTDYAREPAPHGNRVNMGAYGNTPRASLAYNPGVRYVDHASAPGGDGLTWETALTRLQDALAMAVPGQEIWVAEGVYTPGTARTNSFRLGNGVNVYGGFTNGMSDAAQRDWRRHLTVLSGDLNGDDAPNWANRSDNAFHVAVFAGSATLDGFAIVGGQADGAWNTDQGRGGGVLAIGGTPVLRHSVLAGNLAATGGAVFFDGADGQVLDCIISGNLGTEEDGGSGAAGGRNGSLARFRRCQFAGNEMIGRGGVMYTGASPWSSDFINCLLVGNFSWAQTSGLDFRQVSSPARIVNCTFADTPGSSLTLEGSAVTIRNSIFWGATVKEIDVLTGPAPAVLYNNLDQDGYEGIHFNIRSQPIFQADLTGNWTTPGVLQAERCQTVLTAAGAGWAPGSMAGLAVNPDTNQFLHFVVAANTADSLTVWGDAAGFAQTGAAFRLRDFRLTYGKSPGIDAAGFKDAPATDLAGTPRPQGLAPDMGAYEAIRVLAGPMLMVR